jgi:hypothetical protein
MRRKIWSARDIDTAAPVLGGEGGGTPVESDIRLKEEVRQIGSTSHALPLYRFRYKGREEEYAGVMAQDVLEVMPEAVSTGADGFYRVNYSMLGIKLVRLDDDGLSTATDGGEGSGTDFSDIRLKDRIEQIGTIEISIARRD